MAVSVGLCYKCPMWSERTRSKAVQESNVTHMRPGRAFHILQNVEYLPVITGYGMLVILFTWPLPMHLSDRIVLSRGVDAYQHIWNLWWMRFSLFTLHQNPYYTQYLQYPTGQPLAYHSLDPINGLISIPLQGALELLPTFNLLRMAHLLFGAIATYALLRMLRLTKLPAWGGGALFAFSPLVGSSFDLGQLDVISIGWLPLYILCLLKGLGSRALGIKRAAWSWLIAAGIVLALSGLASWYFSFGLVLFTMLYVAFEVAVTWRHVQQSDLVGQEETGYRVIELQGIGQRVRILRILQLVARAGTVGVIALLILSPLLLAALGESFRGEKYVVAPFRTVVENSADLLSFFMPMSSQFENSTINPHGSNPALGWGPISLALLALALGSRLATRHGGHTEPSRWHLPLRIPLHLTFWMLVVLMFCILALGPHLLLGGTDTRVPMPYTLIDGLPFISGLRVPLRLEVFASLALAVLATYGLTTLGQLSIRTGYRILLLLALAVLTVLEFFGIPRTLVDVKVHPFFAAIKATSGVNATASVLELPYDPNIAPAMFSQTVHEHPILGAYTSRHYPYPWVKAAPGIAQLTQFGTPTLRATDISTPQVRDTALASLDYYDVRYVVVHPLRDEGIERKIQLTLESIFEAHNIEPILSDETLTVFRVPPQPQSRPIVGLADGWFLPSSNEKEVRLWRDTSGEAYVLITNPLTETMHSQLRLVAFSTGKARRLSVLLDDRELGQRLVETGASQTFVMPLDLVPGEHWLKLRSQDPPYYLPNDPRPRSVSFEQVAVEPR